MEETLLSQGEFEAWLFSDAPSDLVFVSRSTGCPLAMFLRARGYGVTVGQTEYRLSPTYEQMPLPAWAWRFVARFDMQAGERTVDQVRELYRALFPDRQVGVVAEQARELVLA